METKIIKVCRKAESRSREEDNALRQVGEVIRQGGLAAFPTETVYGLGGDALNPESSRKIYAAKGRPSDNPLIVHICRLEDVYTIAAEVTREAEKLAKAFWPGPLTMILKKTDKVPCETTGGLDTVAVRMPSDETARKIIEYSGGYVAAPSANLSGKPSPTKARYVIEDMMGRIDVIVDGGEGEIGLESTIVDMTVNPPQVLRPGYITKEMLENALGTPIVLDETILRDDSGQAPKAPGMKYRHYAPKGELTIVEGMPGQVIDYINKKSKEAMDAGEKVGIIATKEQAHLYRADIIKNVGSRRDEKTVARNLYRALREFDEESVTVIFSESFDTQGFGQAIMNRLLKAAGHRIIKV
ncbi:MAG: L-threonylcarbamoyladenylate synthase [Lachnoclostridium sp.]|nr:L-threonylcarbamoyladenylate synthase [Lachnoclostridium sp.]MCM1383838.1 L-threonylcarbamoyladenylate synthase [Lachnoclostridium sp.]